MRRGSIVALLGIGLVAGGVATAVALIPTWLPVQASEQAGRIDDRDRAQRQVLLVDAELAARVDHQRAIELVGPAVVGADQAMGVARLGPADLRTAMAADIVKGADLAVECSETRIWTHIEPAGPEKLKSQPIPEAVIRALSQDGE